MANIFSGFFIPLDNNCNRFSRLLANLETEKLGIAKFPQSNWSSLKYQYIGIWLAVLRSF